MNKNKIEKNFDESGDELFGSLYNDDGVMIVTDREEPDTVFTHVIVNKISFSFQIPKKDFLRLTRGMNYAIRAIKIEKPGDGK